MAYISLYNRWRPQSFSTIVGQQAMKQALSNAITSGKIAHAYLFSGPRGTGKTSTARILAKSLNCDLGPTTEPCGKCANCQRITTGMSMDVYELDAASNRGIDDVKNLLEQMAFAPVDGRYKIYIIDEVHMLTTEAFNALLKTLEEPPEHVIFILATTDPHKIPPTIHSRCQRFDFHRITTEDIVEHLAYVAEHSGIKVENEALRLIAIQSEGGMRDALSLLDQCGVMAELVTADTVRQVLGIVGRDALRELVNGIGQGKLSLVLEKLKELFDQGKAVKQIMAELSEYLRAVLLYKAAPDFEDIYLTDTKDSLAQVAKLFGQERLLAAEERIHQAVQELKGAMRPRVTAELCLFDLCTQKGESLAALKARIEKLEQNLEKGMVYQAEQPSILPYTADNTSEDDFAPVDKQETFVKPVAQAKDISVKSEKTKTENKKVKNDKQNPIIEQVAAVEDYGGDWATGEDYWKQVLELLKNEKKISVASCAKNGRVMNFSQDRLVVAFKVPFICQRMQMDDFRKPVEEALLRIARKVIRLECVEEGKAQAVPKKSENVVNKPSAPNTVVPEALQRIVCVFGGNIENIE